MAEGENRLGKQVERGCLSRKASWRKGHGFKLNLVETLSQGRETVVVVQEKHASGSQERCLGTFQKLHESSMELLRLTPEAGLRSEIQEDSFCSLPAHSHGHVQAFTLAEPSAWICPEHSSLP